MSQVRIIFQKPGWFLTDVRCEVHWDGQVVYDGSFMSGFDVVVDAGPGRHALRTQLHPVYLRLCRLCRGGFRSLTAPGIQSGWHGQARCSPS